DPDETTAACRGTGAEGRDQDPHSPDLLHPSLPVPRGPGAGRHPDVRGVLRPRVTSGGRLGLTARAFFLATVLGLALAFQEPKVIQGLLFLFAIGSLALAATMVTFLADRWICFIEGILAAFVVGLALPQGILLLPYLVVPALL